jgi:hypothetical protein
MFFIHLLFFHGTKAQILEPASSADRLGDRVHQ